MILIIFRLWWLYDVILKIPDSGFQIRFSKTAKVLTELLSLIMFCTIKYFNNVLIRQREHEQMHIIEWTKLIAQYLNSRFIARQLLRSEHGESTTKCHVEFYFDLRDDAKFITLFRNYFLIILHLKCMIPKLFPLYRPISIWM